MTPEPLGHDPQLLRESQRRERGQTLGGAGGQARSWESPLPNSLLERDFLTRLSESSMLVLGGKSQAA